jgi:general secretion pathway protein G
MSHKRLFLTINNPKQNLETAVYQPQIVRENRLPNNSRLKSGGFTLIEVMVVVIILGILAAIVVPNVMQNPHKARVTKAKQDIRALESALKMYKLDNFVYPTTEQGLEALVSKPGGTPEPKNWKRYMDRLPKDPWGETYQFLSPGVKGDIDIYSFGADGQPGGEADNTDIGNWELQ